MNKIASSPTLEPVFVRVYPPFAMAMGMAFLSWLTGSIAFDSFFRAPRDTVIGILFGLAFLAAALAALNSCLTLLNLRRCGLHLDETGVTHVPTGLWVFNSRAAAWKDVKEIKQENGRLIFETAPEPLTVFTSDLLENPDWIAERARTWAGTAKPEKDVTHAKNSLAEVRADLESAACISCGGSIELRLEEKETIECPFCGDKQGLPSRAREALKRLSTVISELPAAHRQFRDQALLRFVESGDKHRRTLLRVGWGTASVWLLFAVVEVISELADKKGPGPNLPFVAVSIGLAFLSVSTAYLLVYLIRRMARGFSLPLRALTPTAPGGAARCRLCGAELPQEGLIRQCNYCGTDSVVSGRFLEAAEQSAQKALQQAQATVGQSTETAARLLDNAAYKMMLLDYFQFFWLHIPIIVAMSGSTGMLFRVTGLFLALLPGTLASTIIGMRRLSKKQ